MIGKILKRCFLAGVLVVTFAIGTAACCYALVCWPPGFYAAALEEPIDKTDVAAALQEVEQMVSAMEVFVAIDASSLETLKAMPEEAIATVELGSGDAKVNLADALQTLEEAQGQGHDTYVLSLSERHLNAYLNRQPTAKSNPLQRPYVSLEGDRIRFAVTLGTPAADVALWCDVVPVETQEDNLCFEFHGLSVGRLPLPATTILRQYLRTDPELPEGVDLNIEGARPTVSITSMPDRGKIQIDGLHVAEGKLHLTFRRSPGRGARPGN